MKHIVAIFWLLIGGGCLGMAAYMNVHKITNWGWFLFAGLAILASVTIGDNVTINEDDEEDEL
jgi:cell division protein FtsW (lipid II flippase)